jgi:hypothetical protein
MGRIAYAKATLQLTDEETARLIISVVLGNRFLKWHSCEYTEPCKKASGGVGRDFGRPVAERVFANHVRLATARWRVRGDSSPYNGSNNQG